MRNHQKYFSVEHADGTLASHFITVSNMAADPARDATIRAGNEKVLRARLSDAKFFWDQDRTVTLESRTGRLSTFCSTKSWARLRTSCAAGDVGHMDCGLCAGR